MGTYDIELFWTCRYCRREHNEGLKPHCPGCGHPKDALDEETWPDDLSRANAIRDAKKLREAEAGPNWECKFCKSLQSSLHACCDECGCDKLTGQQRWRMRAETIDVATHAVVESRDVMVEPGPAPDPYAAERAASVEAPAVEASVVEASAVETPAVAVESPAAFRERKDQEAERARRAARPVRVARSAPSRDAPDSVRKFVRPNVAPFVYAGLAALFGVLLWLTFRTTVVEASVTSLAWEHRVHVDRYQRMPHDGWDPPAGAEDVRDLGKRVHHYDHVKVGSHEEKHTEYDKCNCKTVKGECRTVKGHCSKPECKKVGNGTAKCTDPVCAPDRRVCDGDTEKCDKCPRLVKEQVDDYEDQPRYQPYYAWLAWEWQPNRILRRKGSSLDTAWPTDADLAPSAPLAQGEQERSHREASYRVIFTDTDREAHTIEPRTLGVFETYPVGRKVKLKIGVAHGVEVLP